MCSFLGLNRTLNVELLKKVITSKGPSVSSVRVYPSRRNSSKVILKLNLNDDELCDRVLDEGFWPSFVTCRRWGPRTRSDPQPNYRNTSDGMTTGSRKTNGALSGARYGGHELPPRFRRHRDTFADVRGYYPPSERTDFMHTNRYEMLCSEVD